MNKENRISKYILNFALIFILSGLVLWLSLREDGASVIAAIRKADLRWIFVILAGVALIRISVGWNLMEYCHLSNRNYTLKQGIINAFIGGFFNQITPGSSGGQFVQVFIFRRQGIGLSQSAGVLWMDFIVFQVTMVITVFGLILLRFSKFYHSYSQFFLVVLLGFIINLGVIALLYAMARFRRVYETLSRFIFKVGTKFHIIKNKASAEVKLEQALVRFAIEVKKLRGNKQILPKVAGSNLLRLFIYYSVPFAAAKALHIPVSVSQLPDILALTSFVTMVNAFLPMPGSSGGTEATFILMFSTMFHSVEARSIMLVWRFMTYFMDVVMGAAVFAYERTLPSLEERSDAEQ